MSDYFARRLVAFPLMSLVLLLALVAAGCGSDNNSSSAVKKAKAKTTTETTATTDTAATDGTAPTDAAGGGAGTPSEADVIKRADSYDKSPGAPLKAGTKYVVRVTTTMGAFDIAVDQKAGPIAAANFVGLVRKGFYDGIKFHRIIKGFMVQTGDPLGTGTGGPGYAIKDDTVTGEYKPGTVAMANAGPDTGGSQFFIVQGTDVQLEPSYAIFGKVDAAGMKVIDKIANAPVQPGGENSTPVDTIRILSAKLIAGS